VHVSFVYKARLDTPQTTILATVGTGNAPVSSFIGGELTVPARSVYSYPAGISVDSQGRILQMVTSVIAADTFAYFSIDYIAK